MNVKTTVALLACLIIVGAIVYFTSGRSEKPIEVSEKKLIDIASNDVTKLTIKPASDDKPIVFEKADTKWRMSSPIDARADSSSVDSLLSTIAGLESSGKVNPQGEN